MERENLNFFKYPSQEFSVLWPVLCTGLLCASAQRSVPEAQDMEHRKSQISVPGTEMKRTEHRNFLCREHRQFPDSWDVSNNNLPKKHL
jgi:hypothetical protein